MPVCTRTLYEGNTRFRSHLSCIQSPIKLAHLQICGDKLANYMAQAALLKILSGQKMTPEESKIVEDGAKTLGEITKLRDAEQRKPKLLIRSWNSHTESEESIQFRVRWLFPASVPRDFARQLTEYWGAKPAGHDLARNGKSVASCDTGHWFQNERHLLFVQHITVAKSFAAQLRANALLQPENE